MIQPTRDKLLEISIRLMSIKGFNNTGIAEILAEAEVPKGSFYHYFKSKDDLGLAIIERYGNDLCAGLSEFLIQTKGTALARLRAYFTYALDFFERDFGRCNCLLGNLGQELAMQNVQMRKAINKHYSKIEKVISDCLETAKAEGDLAPSANTASLAKMLFSSWEGCLVRAKLEQSSAPLRELLELYFFIVFSNKPVASRKTKKGR